MLHYTCEHGVAEIERTGQIEPSPLELAGIPLTLAAFTLEPRERVAWGDRGPIPCRRTCCAYFDHSFRVRAEGVMPWQAWRAQLLRTQLLYVGTRQWRALRVAVLALERDGNTRHWHVCEYPMRVLERVD